MIQYLSSTPTCTLKTGHTFLKKTLEFIVLVFSIFHLFPNCITIYICILYISHLYIWNKSYIITAYIFILYYHSKLVQLENVKKEPERPSKLNILVSRFRWNFAIREKKKENCWSAKKFREFHKNLRWH